LAEFSPQYLFDVSWLAVFLRGEAMRGFSGLLCIGATLSLLALGDAAQAQVATIYGGGDGLCGHRTASGERFNCAAMTAAHRKLPFGTQVRVCHSGCVTVRINDRGPWVRGADIDLSPAAARAIGLRNTGHVTLTLSVDNQPIDPASLVSKGLASAGTFIRGHLR
jgi:rare lipoprotein A